MQSNSEKPRLGGRVLAAGFVGAIVGALVMGVMPSARGQTPPNGHVPAEDRLAVELYLQKQKGSHWFQFVGCQAREGTNPNPIKCAIDPAMSAKVSNVHFDAIVVRWNGQSGGSGCAKVGGVEYCW
jgi:hypothetical protein